MCDAALQPVLGLIGHELGGNPSQYMIEKAFAYHDLDWRYLSLEVRPEGLGDAIRGMRAMGFAGGNCAEPHKEAVVEHLDALCPTAEATGVVNCLRRDQGRLIGENTEGEALLAAVRRRLDPAGRRVLLLGAGKTARVVAFELARAGVAEITVASRREEPGQQLVELLGSKQAETVAGWLPWDETLAVADDLDVLIHAASIRPCDPDRPLSLGLDALSERVLVVDACIQSPRSWLIAQAADRGCPTIDGVELFVAQAALSFRRWTGLEPDTTVMSEAVEEFLEI